MKKIVFILFLQIAFCFGIASAAVRPYTATGEYIMSPSETLEYGIKKAREDALRQISESVSVYIESQSETKDQQLTQDEIKSISASIIKVTNETAPSIVQHGKGLDIKVTVTATADDSEVFTKKILESKEKDEQLRRTEDASVGAALENCTMVSDLLWQGADPDVIIKSIEYASGPEEDALSGYRYDSLAECYFFKRDAATGMKYADMAIDSYIKYNKYDEALFRAVNAAMLLETFNEIPHAKRYLRKYQKIRSDCVAAGESEQIADNDSIYEMVRKFIEEDENNAAS